MNRLPFFIVLTALLPYLFLNMRFEHIVIPVLLFFSFFHLRHPRTDLLLSVLGLLFALGALLLGSSISGETGLSTSSFNSFVRILMPTIMLMSFPMLMTLVDRPLDRTANAILTFCFIAVVFTIASLQFPYVGDILKYWVRADEENSVWTASRDVGRYNGIFNQPLEAGTFYSVGLIASVYLGKKNSSNRWLLIVSVLMIALGGSLSLSKNFLIIGIAISFIFAMWIGLVSIKWALLIVTPVILILGYYVLQSNVTYFDSLYDLYLSGGTLSALSAGRYGLNESEVSWLFSETWNGKSFLLGHGLGSYLPLDSGYLEFFYQGGIMALSGYLVFLGSIALLAWRHRAKDEGKMLFVLVLYTAAASFGGPIISASRASVPLMLLISASAAGIRLSNHINKNFSRRYLGDDFILPVQHKQPTPWLVEKNRGL
jgi:hypothetical protein